MHREDRVRIAPSKSATRRLPWVAAACLVAALLVGCSGADRRAAQWVLPEGRPPSGEVVVFVPGIMGSKLEDATGRSVWGRGLQVIWPRDRGRRIVLPLEEPTREDELRPTEVLDEVRLLGARRVFYASLSRRLQDAGYVLGDQHAPSAAANLYLFAHDFRLATDVVAGRLARLLERVRAARGPGELRVTLLCQSNGGNVCRYFAKFGGARLEEALAGSGATPKGVRVERMVLAGTANRGSIRMLRELNEGRRLLGIWKLGRWFAPECLMTFRSLYAELPDLDGLFVDADGGPLDVDLYDVEAWRTYGWGVFSPDARRRRARSRAWSALGDDAAWARFLEGQLRSARELQTLFREDSKTFATAEILQIQSRVHATPRRAVMVREEGRWRTRFAGDAVLSEPAQAAAVSPGDGHATEDSLHLSPQEEAVQRTVWLEDEHVDLVLSDAAHQEILQFLLEQVPASP